MFLFAVITLILQSVCFPSLIAVVGLLLDFLVLFDVNEPRQKFSNGDSERAFVLLSLCLLRWKILSSYNALLLADALFGCRASSDSLILILNCLILILNQFIYLFIVLYKLSFKREVYREMFTMVFAAISSNAQDII